MGPSVLHDLRIEGQDRHISHIHQLLASHHCTPPLHSFYPPVALLCLPFLSLLPFLNPLLQYHYVAGVMLSILDCSRLDY